MLPEHLNMRSYVSGRQTAPVPAAAATQRELDRLFSRAAPLYDLQLRFERRALRTAAGLAGPLAGRRVLDVATGTGALAEALVRHGGAPAALVAVDRLPAMLHRARRRLSPLLPPGRLRVLRGDALRLPSDLGAFDLVTLGYLLHLLPPDAAVGALREAARVLRSGGRVIAVTHSSPAGRLRAPYVRGWAIARLLTGGRVIGAGPLDDLAPLAGRAGLRPAVSVRVPGAYWSQVLLADAPGPAPGVS